MCTLSVYVHSVFIVCVCVFVGDRVNVWMYHPSRGMLSKFEH